MNLNDLKSRMVVETKNGDLFVVLKRVIEEDLLVGLKSGISHISLKLFNDDLTYVNGNHIMKVYKDFTLKEILWERKSIPDNLGDLINDLFYPTDYDSCEFVTIESEDPDCDTYDGLLDDIDGYLNDETVDYTVIGFILKNGTAIIEVKR